RRMLDDLAGIEGHQQALARSLGVPDHPRLAVAAGRTRSERAGHGLAHGMELMVAGKNLDDIVAGVAKDEEIPDQTQKQLPPEYAFQDGFQLWRALRRKIVTRHSPPWHETFPVRCQRADARRNAVRN